MWLNAGDQEGTGSDEECLQRIATMTGALVRQGRSLPPPRATGIGPRWSRRRRAPLQPLRRTPRQRCSPGVGSSAPRGGGGDLQPSPTGHDRCCAGHRLQPRRTRASSVPVRRGRPAALRAIPDHTASTYEPSAVRGTAHPACAEASWCRAADGRRLGRRPDGERRDRTGAGAGAVVVPGRLPRARHVGTLTPRVLALSR